MSKDSANQGTSGCNVFVSYASQDVAVADAIVAALEQNGITCWIAPRDVTPGTLYADGIIRAINDSKAMVLVLSASSIASKRVGKEVERASSKGRPIVALKVDATPLTTALEYFLSESQWIDVAALGMPGALAKLTQAVGQALAAPSGVNPVLGADLGASGPPVSKRPVGTKCRAGGRGSIRRGCCRWCCYSYLATEAPRSTSAGCLRDLGQVDCGAAVADMSEKKDQEYFGDGMAEEILDLLAKIPGLTVIGRTSSFQFKGKNEDLRAIGTRLNVAHVLEGSVRKAGDRVRITAQLINARNGAHEWSETYDRQIGDVLKLQDAIAASVARELQLTVAFGNLRSGSDLKNPEAYDLMLRGRHASDRFIREGLDEAISLFKQVLERDPDSDDAYFRALFRLLRGRDRQLSVLNSRL
jgi:TolB-like protein